MSRASSFLSTHLLLVVTFFFALGISLALQINFMQGRIFLLPLFTGSCALFSHLRRHHQTTLFLLLPFIASLGFVHGTLAGREPPSPNNIFHLIKQEQEAILLCTLTKMPGFNGENSSLLVEAHSLRLKDSTDYNAAHGLVQLKLKAPWPKNLLPGDQIAIRARLDRPHTFHNPGSFDYPTFLARQDIRITGWIKSPLYIYRLDEHPTFLHQARYLPERLRSRIGSFIEQTVTTPDISSVYKALLIGDVSGINQETLEAFKGSGCRHILSISGAHLSILATFLFFIIYWLLRRSEYLILRYPVKKIAAGLCLLPLAIYTLLAGANTPVIRAMIMVTVFMVALCADKRKSLFIPLALAALLILLWDPNSLFTASFQLSFMAVASIALVSPILTRLVTAKERKETFYQRMRSRLCQFTLAALTVSMAATIGTAPLLLSYFNRISVVGPAANLPVESLICLWSLPLGFLACPLIFIAPPAAALFLHLGSIGLMLSLKVTTFFSNLPFSSLWLPTPSLTLIVLYYAAILVAISGIPVSRNTRILSAGTWVLSIFLIIFPPSELLKQRVNTSDITFLDVGQGSSTFLQLPAGRRLLIDGGGATSPNFNAGEDIIAPFLWQRGIKHLDAIIITHSDSDHYNGIPFLLQRFRPEILWINDRSGHEKAWRQMLALADQLHIQIRIPRPGEQLIESGKAEVVHLGNPGEPDGARSNDQSLILRFAHAKLSCLFAGDISHKVESQLVEKSLPLQSTLLLSPHHGSSTSNSEKFLKTVNPDTIVVSAGRFRPDHFPTPEVRKRCLDLGIKMLITAEQGAITFTEP
ncbi:MAG: DNA internalization-related competence protein ComEC/Rec2 [Proteobacteria bacterium]|nr:DNA internalization-related competence protein ComEC/Rec2 [Pseudomonadota bacterium]MBU1647945.1 DNA internalization-related competence protein ComEC/Rec2 [Pseudomonadota bacterium]MBU1985840.1 DNA internalization-related competence protein ComEC/Rec2 [Pseudomonadota bacterium]